MRMTDGINVVSIARIEMKKTRKRKMLEEDAETEESIMNTNK